MKTLALLALVTAAAVASTFGQYSARTLTSKVAPQPQPAQPARPATPQYAPVVAQPAPQKPLTQAEATKAQAQKDKNEAKQLEFYKRRAEEGSDHAQYELGMRYLAGKGISPDEKLAREWLGKAAKQGNTQATKKLAELGPEPKKEITATPAEKAITAAKK